MELTILRKDDQVSGSFDGGRIKELKPLGFPQDRGKLRPYGNLFYWAYAWADSDSLIGEHPHKGFEILSFVLKGSIEHYDSQLCGWKPFAEGDVQIIRAGSGITHAEKMQKGAELFQIWLDPGLERTLDIPASYDDYRAATFAETETPAGRETVYTSIDRVSLMSEAVTISRMRYAYGTHTRILPDGMAASLFVLDGSVALDNEALSKGDFLRITDVNDYELGTIDADVFTILTPLRPCYHTYQEMMQSRMKGAC